MLPPKHVPFWEGPAPEEGMPRVSRELQGAGAPRTRREKGADSGPPREEHPLMSPRSFVSARHKSSGDPRFRTGLQSGQAIVREGGERPVTKSIDYLFIRTSTPYARVHACLVLYEIITGTWYYLVLMPGTLVLGPYVLNVMCKVSSHRELVFGDGEAHVLRVA